MLQGGEWSAFSALHFSIANAKMQFTNLVGMLPIFYATKAE
jgi:hypothetical protein